MSDSESDDYIIQLIITHTAHSSTKSQQHSSWCTFPVRKHQLRGKSYTHKSYCEGGSLLGCSIQCSQDNNNVLASFSTGTVVVVFSVSALALVRLTWLSWWPRYAAEEQHTATCLLSCQDSKNNPESCLRLMCFLFWSLKLRLSVAHTVLGFHAAPVSVKGFLLLCCKDHINSSCYPLTCWCWCSRTMAAVIGMPGATWQVQALKAAPAGKISLATVWPAKALWRGWAAEIQWKQRRRALH